MEKDKNVEWWAENFPVQKVFCNQDKDLQNVRAKETSESSKGVIVILP